MLSHDIIDGEPTLIHIKMPKMKLAEQPYIAICVPVGDKEDKTLFTCHKEQGGCGKNWLQSGIRHPLLVPVRHMTNRDNLATPLNTVSVTLVQAGMYSAPARQIMTKKALELGVTYILYLDDDTIVPRNGLDKLHEFMVRHPQVGAVGGVCMARKTPPEPVIFREHGNGCWWECPVGPGAVPQPVWSPGAGMLMARASAVQDVIGRMTEANNGVEVPIWADENEDVEHNGLLVAQMWGHDVRFSKLLNEHGWPVYVHGEVLCGHLDVATDTVLEVPEDMPGMTGPRDVPRPECTELVSKEPENIDTSVDHVYEADIKTGPSVDVIMVTYNQPELEQRTKEAILAHTEYSNYTLRMYQNKKGVGMAECWNKLIAESKAEYICLINSDTVPTKGWLTKLMESANVPNFGAIVPSSNHVHMSQIPTRIDHYEESFDVINDFAASLDMSPPEIQELNMASGMCLLFPRAVWEEVGKFDEDFYFYGEDTEFTWRIANKFNKKLLWRKDAYVHHYGQQSLVPAAETDGWDYKKERERAMRLFTQKTGVILGKG